MPVQSAIAAGGAPDGLRLVNRQIVGSEFDLMQLDALEGEEVVVLSSGALDTIGEKLLTVQDRLGSYGPLPQLARRCARAPRAHLNTREAPMDRPTFLVALDDLARAVATRAPGAAVGSFASATVDGWVVYINGAPLFLGETPADLESATRDLAEVQGGLGLVLRGAPHRYQDGARVTVQAVVMSAGPVGIS
jgi:hypothetical protein